MTIEEAIQTLRDAAGHWWRRASAAEGVLSVIRDILDDEECALTCCDRIEQAVAEYERSRKAAAQGDE